MTNPADANAFTREYFDSILIESRLIDADTASTQLQLYGEDFATPVMMAALSHLNNTYPDGMVEMAKGAKAAGAVNWAGMGDEEELCRIAETGARTIKIIKPYEDRELIHKRIELGEKLGLLGVGIDIDHAFNSSGGYDNVLGMPMKSMSLNELREFISSTKLPFIVKGVLSVSDAVKCAEAGARGIVVSHHHGIMPYAIPPLMVLPEIARALGGYMPIFVDCGVSSGADVFKALALGATAVSVGRGIMGPLHDKGADGVTEAVNGITAQLRSFMNRTGCRRLRSISPDLLWTKDGKKLG